MDFSAFNPTSTNSLSLAARLNNVPEVRRLLKRLNPNCTDNRGWTCLHEAAANDNIESLKIILEHPKTRLLAETFEGHSALYLAVRNKCSIDLINLLLNRIDDIVNYASTEMVSPLHLACQQGRLDVIQLLLEHNPIFNLSDWDGDTPLHDAAFNNQPEALRMLLYCGAEPENRNDKGYTPFHLACMKGNLKCVEELYPFVCDVDAVNGAGETALLIATRYGETDVVQFLLWNGADPNLVDENDQLPLIVALVGGYVDVFKLLFRVTDKLLINSDIITLVCKPHNFNLEIFRVILESDLGPEFFHHNEKFFTELEKLGGFDLNYEECPPLASMLHVSEYIYKISPEVFTQLFYLYLMRGVPVNARNDKEVPPLVYLHYCEHKMVCSKVIEILVSMGCNVDYCVNSGIPNALLASISTTGITLSILFSHSVFFDHRQIAESIDKWNLYGRLWPEGREQLSLICGLNENATLKDILSTVPSLKQCSRASIRSAIKVKCRNTEHYLNLVNQIPLPHSLIYYIRYITY